ncbi:MAG TPA: RNase adapter RapZ [Dongiaceae bacterium]|nr:RNase adapter RapZ [Dongiaceae bacterium]
MSGLIDTPARELVILTGLSGSGKTLAVRSFEDSGYFCVDNLPVTLIPVFADLCTGARQDIRRAALVIDVREGDLLREFPEVYRRIKSEPGRRMRLIFFEADDETLIRRFSETRRPHPLASGGGLEEGIRRERAILAPLRDLADLILDSSRYNVHDLRRYIQEHLTPATTAQAMVLTILSFGYKHGIPPESDLVFDTRFLPNPFFVPELRGRTGLDREVKEFLDALPEFGALRERLGSLLDFLIPHYMREGKSYLTAAIGCTGGRHRSVALAEALAGDLKARGFAVTAAHRDVDKE